MPGTKGRLLVATPLLTDPNFERTVVLMLEDNEEGALGLVLNRPSELEVEDPLPDWADLSAPPPVVFADATLLHAVIDGVRVFAGYAGWDAQQLRDEIAESAWFVVDAQPSDATTDDPDVLWRDVLRRQPDSLRLFANYPPDPAVN